MFSFSSHLLEVRSRANGGTAPRRLKKTLILLHAVVLPLPEGHPYRAAGRKLGGVTALEGKWLLRVSWAARSLEWKW